MALDKNTVSKEAQKYASKGQFDKAVAEWKKLLKETRDTRDLAAIYNTIGDLYLKKDAKTDAADAFKRSADILAEDGLESKAIAVYKKVLNLDPKRVEVHLAIGDLNAQKGLTGNALESYKIVADHYQKNKDMAKVLGIYQKMADLNASNVNFRIKLADMYAKEGMKPEAARAYLAAATVHVGGNKFNEARQLFEKVLTLDPENKEVYHKAGIVYFKEGKFAEACKSLKRIFEADPANEEVADLYLEALSSAGREQDAPDVYQKVLAASPERLDIREKLFRLCLAQKKFDAATAEATALADAKREQMELDAGTEVFAVLIEAAPDHPAARHAFAEFCSRAGRAEEGAREFVRYAQLVAASGDRDGARKALDQAMKLWPGHEEARQVMDQLESAPSAPPPPPPPAAAAFEEPAVPEAAEAPPQPLEDHAIIEGLTEAEVLLKYGLASKAIEQLENLVAGHPDSLRLHLRLRELHREQGAGVQAAEHAVRAADICASRGESDRAEALLREAVEIDPRNAEANARLGLEAPPPEEETAEVPMVEEVPAPVEEAPSALGGDLSFASPDTAEEEPAGIAEDALEEISGDAFEELSEETEETGETPLQREIGPVEEAAPPAGLEQEPAEPSRELAAESLEGELDVNEVWAEAEFYYQQGLYDEARKKYEKILELKPDDARTLKRIREIGRQKEEVAEFSSLAEAVEGLESLVSDASSATAELATATSDEEAVRSLMQDIKSAQYEEEMRRQAREQERREREQREREERDRAEQERLAREQREQEERERAELERRAEAERRYRELKAEQARAEHEARLRSEQEARVRAERELIELKTQREREEQEARIRAEQEAREKAERELQQLRAQWEQEKRDRDRLALEAREQAEREAREKAERELRELQAKREREAAAAKAQAAEEDFGDLGEELRTTMGAGAVPAPARPAAAKPRRREDDFSEFEAAFAQFGEEKTPSQPAAAAAANDDDFFDLASELKEELGAVPIPDLGIAETEDQSLEDIFEDFKKGVEQQEGAQDANSHYNLGIAYKEMGLLDDAIAEFLLTTEGEPKFVESRYLLGLCYLEQGEYHKAIAEIHNALNYAMSFPVSEEERINMLYDLGLAYQGAGNTSEAINQFEMVLNADPHYRDVAVKLHELKAGEFVSLDQLKEDIEKEISSKFLEEGERIEREEKTRKNDAVRN